MAVDHKITITRGDTWDDLKVGWKDSDPAQMGRCFGFTDWLYG